MRQIENLQINKVGDVVIDLFDLKSSEIQIFKEPCQVNIIANVFLQANFSYYVFQLDRLATILRQYLLVRV